MAALAANDVPTDQQYRAWSLTREDGLTAAVAAGVISDERGHAITPRRVRQLAEICDVKLNGVNTNNIGRRTPVRTCQLSATGQAA